MEDCVALDKNNSKTRIRIQVIRAMADQGMWRQLAKAGRVSGSNVHKTELLRQLKQSIEKKANITKIPPAIRASLILALDATLLPALSFDDVIEEFKFQFGVWASSLGFQSIWLVGPMPALTWRLDSQL